MENNVAENNVAEVATPQEQPTAEAQDTNINLNDDTTEETTPPADGADNTIKSDDVSQTKAFSERLNKERERFNKEKEEAVKPYQDLINTLNGLGFKGEKPSELIQAIKQQELEAKYKEMSQNEGIPIEDIRYREERNKQEEESRIKELAESLPEYQEAIKTKEEAERVVREYEIKKDLEAIKKEFPDIQAENMFDENGKCVLGDTYLSLMKTGEFDAVTAYSIQQFVQSKDKKKAPPSMGDIKNNGGQIEKDYLSPEEVDRLPEEAYDNPKIMKIIEKSMPKWR